ncbi:hypothetical protein NHX12_005314 [Muraenolepis orangiensis]|uniref:General transcription factor II-I repeat domain-containing protein 2A n=1 Tax=Muraenolepis orangiensis TaxID=630683 RepID=A0A9Q0IDK9_9TELE|nr:hypothetical protein NHX12_005314 [Muraenolepis orangiensis]
MCDRQFGEVMSLVIRVINFIVARALNDRQFKTLLDEVNNYPGLLLHSNVRWLSRGKVLSRFAACLNEIRTFLEMKGVGHPELADTEWLLKFYYLVDLTEHLNQLNVKMQGIGNTVLSLQQAVFAFENKLELFITDLETGRLLHFEKLSQFKDACTASEPIQNLDLHQLAGCTSSLLQSFKARFGEFREHTRLFKFITHPNECSLNTADLNYIPGVSVRDFEAEVADLKASDMWVNKFKSLNEDLERITRQKAELASKHMWTEMKKLQPEDQLILKTWNALPVTYHTLQRKKTDGPAAPAGSVPQPRAPRTGAAADEDEEEVSSAHGAEKPSFSTLIQPCFDISPLQRSVPLCQYLVSGRQDTVCCGYGSLLRRLQNQSDFHDG